jgi:hypothetical protein
VVEISEPMLPWRCARLAACALTLALACAKYSGRSDENFAKARELYEQLYVTQLDEAYGDPKMDEVVELLGKVNKRSVDAPSAQALMHAIEHGRDDLAKAHAEREKLQQAAAEVVATPSTIDPTHVLGRADAGPPQDPFGPGALISDINKDSGGCLVAAEQFRENVTNKSGTLYRLSANAACKDKLPGFVGQVVMVSEGKVYRRVSEAEVPRPPAASGGAPDGGVAAVRDAGAAPAQKPAAGEQHASTSAYPSSDAVATASDGGQ